MSKVRGESPSSSRIGGNSKLGDYVEYREPWWRSLPLIGLWLAAELIFALQAFPAGTPVPITDRLDYVLATMVCVFGAAFFIWRSFFGEPGLRVGENGFEIRTNLLRHRFVDWQDVEVLGPLTYQCWFWCRMNVSLFDSAVAPGSPTWVTVRLSGLSASVSDIEADMAARVHKAYKQRRKLVGDRAAQVIDTDRRKLRHQAHRRVDR